MFLLFLACGPPPEPAPCTVSGDPALKVAPVDVEFGAFQEGDPLYYGIPPQGGPLFSPFHARVSGIPSLDLGAVIHLVGWENDQILASTDYTQRLVCANVGENQGQWLGPDLHLRFGDWSREDLAGRTLRLELEVANLDGVAAQGSLVGVLVEMEE
jgi:hypothetical protein